jgi:hypothetical protein
MITGWRADASVRPPFSDGVRALEAVAGAQGQPVSSVPRDWLPYIGYRLRSDSAAAIAINTPAAMVVT